MEGMGVSMGVGGFVRMGDGERGEQNIKMAIDP